ncbi:MAG: hypothetical protein PF689_12265 [Deltaproteobacteria bacterium]|jgi:hypothetical protein|nr:hypothetical protein [Deltaproteobacteria bacterium]
MKKISIFASLLMLSMVFAACDKKEESSEDKEDKAEKADKTDKTEKKEDKKKSDLAEVKKDTKKTQPAGDLKDPPKLEWKGYKKSKAVVEGIDGSQIWFYMSSTALRKSPLNMHISIKKLPEGTTVQIKDKKFTVDKSDYAYFDYLMKDQIGEVPLSSIYHKRIYKKKRHDFNLKFTLSIPGYKPVTANVPPIDPSKSLGRYLMEVEDGSIKFKNEPKTDGKIDTMIQVSKYGSPFVIGKGKKVHDIDLVTVVRKEESEQKIKCEFKKYGKIDITLMNAKVAVYNRHTGKKLGEDVIKNDKKCPRYGLVDKKTKTGKKRVKQKMIQNWVKKNFKKYKNMK